MTIRLRPPGEELQVSVTVRVPTFYLDHCAIRHFADDAHARERLLTVLQSKGTLLFSWVNSAEISGNRGMTSASIRALFDGIGCNWYPLDPNPWKVMRRAAAGRVPEVAVCADEDTFKAYANQVGSEMVSLAGMVDIMSNQRLHDSVRAWKEKMGDILRKAKQDWTRDRDAPVFRVPAFDPNRPVAHVRARMVQDLFSSGSKISANDGADMSHAVVATAVGQFVVLDRRWATFAKQIGRTASVASAFRLSEVAAFLSSLESWSDDDR